MLAEVMAYDEHSRGLQFHAPSFNARDELGVAPPTVEERGYTAEAHSAQVGPLNLISTPYSFGM
jgi:hypothetical protein